MMISDILPSSMNFGFVEGVGFGGIGQQGWVWQGVIGDGLSGGQYGPTH